MGKLRHGAAQRCFANATKAQPSRMSPQLVLGWLQPRMGTFGAKGRVIPPSSAGGPQSLTLVADGEDGTDTAMAGGTLARHRGRCHCTKCWMNNDILPHPPRSPDLSPTHGHFFKHLDNSLQGKRFRSQQDAENAFQELAES